MLRPVAAAASRNDISRSLSISMASRCPRGSRRMLDVLETQLYDSGMNGNSSDAQFILKHRRYGTGEPPAVKSNFMLNITLAEHTKRLERLGLPVPQIEGDYEDDDEQIKSGVNAPADHS
jgi:hypothetical protein